MITSLIRLDSWTRQFVPAAMSFVLLSAQFLPWGGIAGPIVPCLGLISVFYWSVRLPGAIPPLVALLLGCYADLLAMTPLGAEGLSFLAIALLAKHRRRRVANPSFLGLWGTFTVVCLGQQGFLWLMSALVSWTALPLGPILPQTLSTIILFPVVTRLILLPAERMIAPNA